MEEDLLSISALQHYAYCPRQCALIYLYDMWQEDFNTALGTMLHDRVDHPGKDKRAFLQSIRSLKVSSSRLHLTGVIDLTEYDAKQNCYMPIEYKKGKPKQHRADEIQLCAYALCLEESTHATISEGFIWYYEIRKRVKVIIDRELRDLTLETIEAVRKLFESGLLPKAQPGPRCKGCSLLDVCAPARYSNDWSEQYVQSLYALEATDTEPDT